MTSIASWNGVAAPTNIASYDGIAYANLASWCGITWPPNQTYIEDVFSAYTYTGNSSTQTIINGIDLAGKGGMVWTKGRSSGYDNTLIDTIRGPLKGVFSDATLAEISYAASLTGFNSNGYSLGADGTGAEVNNSGINYVSWSFAQANKFFKKAQATVSGGVTATVDLSSLGTVGMVAVKRTDSTSAWFVLHRSGTTGKLLYFNTTDDETTDGSITLSGTTLSLVGGTIANGTYIVYAWAHDISASGLIQVGSFASANPATVTLGWEPQYVLLMKIGAAGSDKAIFDTARKMAVTNDNRLRANANASEDVDYGAGSVIPTATGFTSNLFASGTILYVAIRRGPMKLPTVGTQVYNAAIYTGNATARSITGVGFPPDTVIAEDRTATYGYWFDRLRGADVWIRAKSSVEDTSAGNLTSFDMDGFTLGTGINITNTNTNAFVAWCLRRFPGAYDTVCFDATTSTNRRISHNLGVAPEMAAFRRRGIGFGSNMYLYHKDMGRSQYGYLGNTTAFASATNCWGTTDPTATDIGMDETLFFGNAQKIVGFLFATVPGVSKVGSFIGNGSSQTINMGFSAGARFFLCRRADSGGSIFVWDSARGIVSGNDPHVYLEDAVAEVTTDDSVDPDNSGIIVNEIAATHINVTSSTYIYLAFS